MSGNGTFVRCECSLGLNPYYTGSYSMSFAAANMELPYEVLILIILEVTL